ncbi:unnamed protein product [Sphagnum troendelagicum]
MGSGIMGGGSEGEKEGERHVALSLKPPLSPLRVRASRHGNLHVEVSRLGNTITTLHDPSPLYSPCASPFAPDLSVPEEALLWVDEVGLKEKEKVPALLHDHYLRRHSMRRRGQCAAIVVGHYCHDRLTLHGGRVVESLGGSVSYITNVFQALGMECEVAAKVGPNFLYSSQITHPPKEIPDQLTTEFFADFTLGEERVLTAGHICEPIQPEDIPEVEFELGLAVGIAGEVLPETVKRMVEVSRYVVVDVQALIRTIDPETGLVGLRKLEETPFYDLLHGISFLKAARNEACYLDLETVRQKTVVIVTEGKHGSRVYSKDREYRVPAFPATEVDPTGAGDSFLAGFSAGLYQGLPVEQAVLMGNYFGGLAVGQVGVPHFTENQLQNLKECHEGFQVEELPFQSHAADAGQSQGILCSSQ